jgi:hypothetical protein
MTKTLVERLREWERIERVADLPRDPRDTRVADLLAEARSRIEELERALGMIALTGNADIARQALSDKG